MKKEIVSLMIIVFCSLQALPAPRYLSVIPKLKKHGLVPDGFGDRIEHDVQGLSRQITLLEEARKPFLEKNSLQSIYNSIKIDSPQALKRAFDLYDTHWNNE